MDPAGTGQAIALGDIGELLRRASEERDRLHATGRALKASLGRVVRRCVESVPPNAKRILIVDDDDLALRAFMRAVSEIHPSRWIHVAPSLAAAKAKVERYAYDVLVVDWQLGNGYAAELVRTVRARSRSPLAWVLLISGTITEQSGPQMARDVGANDWMAKPFDAVALQDRIHKAFAAQSAERR